MIEIQTLLIFLLIFYILNITQNKKELLNTAENKKELQNTTKNKKELQNTTKNKKQIYKPNIETKIRKYGEIQYDVINYDNNDVQYKHQDFDIIKEDNILELNKPIKYNFQKNTVTDLPCQQDIIYDTKFYQPSDGDIYNPTDLTKINYKERKIEDVYNEIVNGNNVKIKNKKKLNDFSEFKSGASGLKTYRNIDWEYEDEDDGMAYDPRTSSLSIF